MAARLYIVPEIGSGTKSDVLRAKYLDSLGPLGPTAMMRYGFQPIRLVGTNLIPAQDTALVANADVFAFPFDLTTLVGGGGVQAARDALELSLIPAQWVSGQMAWLEVAKTVAGMFQFMNRLKGFLPSLLLDNAAKLNIQWGTVPVDIQNAVISCAQSLGYSTAFITPTTQLRTVLQTFASAWGAAPIFVGPVVLQ